MARPPAASGHAPRFTGLLAGWWGLARFWLIVLLVVGTGAASLQMLGPPHRPTGVVGTEALPRPAVVPAKPQEGAAAPAVPPLVVQQRVPPPRNQPGREQPGPIADPDPTLLEPGIEGSQEKLPRIAADGRQPMQVYAAGFDRSNRRPRISLLLAGIGLSEADSLKAIRTLPGPVSLAISPYGGAPERLLAAARAAQHEYLLSLPMEPREFPLNDPGNRALMTNLSGPDNLKRLFWAMSRFAGYVGVTGALGDQRGERFAGTLDQMEPVLRQVAQRGLLYVDPRPGEAPLPLVWNRSVDIVLDEPTNADAINARLAVLEDIARANGVALGLAGAPRPVTLARIAAWAADLSERGFVLAPVSAIVRPPPGEPSAAEEPSRGAAHAGAPARDATHSDAGMARATKATAE